MASHEYHHEYYIKNKARLARQMREYYEKNKEHILAKRKEYHENNREKENKACREYHRGNAQLWARKTAQTGQANSLVNRAVSRGDIKRKPCEVCGEQKAEAHHDDYNKPLEVRWLCRECHGKWHRYNKPKYIGED